MRSPKKITKKKQKLRDLKTNKIYRFDLPCCNSAPQNLGQSHACVMTLGGSAQSAHGRSAGPTQVWAAHNSMKVAPWRVRFGAP